MKKYSQIINRLSLAFLLICAINSSCTKTEGYKRSPIKSDLKVSLEIYDDAKILLVETTDIYHCANYEIFHVLKGDKTEMEIQFRYIKEYEICLRAQGPASARIDIDQNEKVNFKMKLKGKWYKGTVLGDEISLENSGSITVKE